MGFKSFLGNPKAVAAVRDMLATGRMPHSILFSGPDGVGKKTLALMLAKALNCERRPDDFCGECRACRKAEGMLSSAREDLARRREVKESARRVEGLVYFDVQLIEPITRYTLIEQIRQLRNIAYTRPFELKRRVFVVDQIQAVHWQAVDLLLKVLEEPPGTTTFILICPNPNEIRPTIRSRCRRVQFLPVDDATVESVLDQDDRLPQSERALAVRLAAGSIARARSLDLAGFHLQRRSWLEFLEGASARNADWKALFDSAKLLAEDREQFESTLRVGYSLLRDLLQLVEGRPESTVVNADVLPRLRTWAPRIGLAGISRLKDGLDQAYRLQSRNVNQQLGLETLAIEVQSLGRER